MKRLAHTFRGSLALWIILACLVLTGCAPILIAGGAVGGYALAKDMEDGQLIDSKDSKGK